MEEKPICRSCNFMQVTSYAKTTGNNSRLKGPRGDCMCKHPDAVKTFNKVCPRSPRMAAFIVLKLTGVINWSWLWVLAPIWIPTAITLAIIVIVLVVILVRELTKGGRP